MVHTVFDQLENKWYKWSFLPAAIIHGSTDVHQVIEIRNARCSSPSSVNNFASLCVDHLFLHSYPGASDVSCGPRPSPSSLSNLYYPQLVHRDFPATQSLPLDLSVASPCVVILRLACYISGKDMIRDVHLHLILQDKQSVQSSSISEPTRSPQDPQVSGSPLIPWWSQSPPMILVVISSLR
jgi:hypothetical protein